MNPLADALITPLASQHDTVLIRHDHKEISGIDLYLLTSQIANVLTDIGVEPGHRVAMQTEKTVEALALYLGCLRAGALFLPLNTAYTPAEMEYFIGNAEPTLVVCDPKSEAALS